MKVRVLIREDELGDAIREKVENSKEIHIEPVLYKKKEGTKWFCDAVNEGLYERQMSMRELGSRVGVTAVTIAKYIYEDRIPAADIFLRICIELEIDPVSVKFRSKK